MKIIVDIPEDIIDTINDDQFISREQLAVLQKHIMDGAAQYSKGYNDGFIEAKKLFEPERPQGEWLLLRTNYEDSGNNFYKCSICHYSDIHADSTEVPFCWHCGARMKTKKGGQP